MSHIGISIECAFGNIAEYLHLLVFIALTDNSSGALFQISRSPRNIEVMDCDQLLLDIRTRTHFGG